MTFDELRITYQCPERLARILFEELEQSRAARAQTEAMLALAEGQRNKTLNLLAPPAPRRMNRDQEQN